MENLFEKKEKYRLADYEIGNVTVFFRLAHLWKLF